MATLNAMTLVDLVELADAYGVRNADRLSRRTLLRRIARHFGL